MRLVRSLRRPSASASLAFITYIDTTTHTYTVLPHDIGPMTCHYGIGVAASASMPLGMSGSIGGGRSASSASSTAAAAASRRRQRQRQRRHGHGVRGTGYGVRGTASASAAAAATGATRSRFLPEVREFIRDTKPRTNTIARHIYSVRRVKGE